MSDRNREAVEALAALIYGENWRDDAPWAPAAVAPMVEAVARIIRADVAAKWIELLDDVTAAAGNVRAEVGEKIAQAINNEYKYHKHTFGKHPTNMEQWYLDGLVRGEQIALSFKEGNEQ
jgi:hypothetical protein